MTDKDKSLRLTISDGDKVIMTLSLQPEALHAVGSHTNPYDDTLKKAYNRVVPHFLPRTDKKPEPNPFFPSVTLTLDADEIRLLPALLESRILIKGHPLPLKISELSHRLKNVPVEYHLDLLWNLIEKIQDAYSKAEPITPPKHYVRGERYNA